jgi:hypothetical protein
MAININHGQEQISRSWVGHYRVLGEIDTQLKPTEHGTTDPLNHRSNYILTMSAAPVTSTRLQPPSPSPRSPSAATVWTPAGGGLRQALRTAHTPAHLLNVPQRCRLEPEDMSISKGHPLRKHPPAPP